MHVAFGASTIGVCKERFPYKKWRLFFEIVFFFKFWKMSSNFLRLCFIFQSLGGKIKKIMNGKRAESLDLQIFV